MEKTIRKLCKQIEKEKNIKILFCVESGSRVWRMHSEDSDYDVRFVYYRPIQEYLKIDSPGDVITKAYNKDGEPMSQEGCFFDFSGFDIFKFARMLHSSNPTVIEWLRSDILYAGSPPEIFIDFAENHFKPISLYYHYKSMCKQNYLKYLKSGNLVTYKKYLYAMRGLINARFIAATEKLPPIDFNNTLQLILKYNIPLCIVPTKIIGKIEEIIKLKKEGKEKDIVQNIVSIDNYIEEFLKDDSDAPENIKSSVMNRELNDEIWKIIKRWQ